MIECPIPKQAYDHIVLGHGSGGRLTADLIERVFLPGFGGALLSRLEDQATLELRGASARIAFTTDSFVVRPLFFPGGDIGKLAVYGTVNDLAVGGAVPRFLSAAFILEEGVPISDLSRIVASMRQIAPRQRSECAADLNLRACEGAVRSLFEVTAARTILPLSSI